MYVSDEGNDRLQKFDNNGRFVTKWGSTGSNPGQFDAPTGIAEDSLDNIYVSDSLNDRVQ